MNLLKTVLKNKLIKSCRGKTHVLRLYQNRINPKKATLSDYETNYLHQGKLPPCMFRLTQVGFHSNLKDEFKRISVKRP